MNKRDYVSALCAQLKTLPSNDVEEIAKEFEAHFDIGVSEGKTEEEIAAKLGSPEEVAQIYLSDTVPGFDVAAAANAANAPNLNFPVENASFSAPISTLIIARPARTPTSVLGIRPTKLIA